MKLSKADIKSFSEEQENVNTKKKTLYDLKLFEKERTSRNSYCRTTAVHDKVCAGSVRTKNVIHNKKKITQWLEDMNFIFLW